MLEELSLQNTQKGNYCFTMLGRNFYQDIHDRNARAVLPQGLFYNKSLREGDPPLLRFAGRYRGLGIPPLLLPLRLLADLAFSRVLRCAARKGRPRAEGAYPNIRDRSARAVLTQRRTATHAKKQRPLQRGACRGLKGKYNAGTGLLSHV